MCLLGQTLRDGLVRSVAPFRMVVLTLVAVSAFFPVRARWKTARIRSWLAQELFKLGSVPTQRIVRRHKPVGFI